jgi:hypothetical protein
MDSKIGVDEELLFLKEDIKSGGGGRWEMDLEGTGSEYDQNTLHTFSLFSFIEKIHSHTVVVNTFNPSTWEAEVGGSVSLRLAWSTE